MEQIKKDKKMLIVDVGTKFGNTGKARVTTRIST